MTIQAWHTLVRLEYQKCQFPPAVDDRLQRDIFVIGLNDTFKRFRSDVIARENFTALSFAQVISKARDFEDQLRTESAITQHQLEEAAHKVIPSMAKSTRSCQQFRRPGHPTSPTSSASPATHQWCGRIPHTNRRDCPAANAPAMGAAKRGTGTKCASQLQQKRYQTQLWSATLQKWLASSPMALARCSPPQRPLRQPGPQLL